MSNLLTLAKKLKASIKEQNGIDIEHDSETHIIKIGDLTYIPSKTGFKFHNCKSLVKSIMGAYNSGKTICGIFDLLINALNMPFCLDGVRRSKFGIIRNTYSELQTTTLKSFKNWFSNLGDCKFKGDSPITYTSSFYDNKGRIDIEVLFLSMDKDKDINKLQSFEATSILVDESRNMNPSLIEHMKTRINRYPSKSLIKDGVEYQHNLLLVTNPPDLDTYYYNLFEVEKPEGYTIFKQPPGILQDENGKRIINPDADNLENISKNYYLEACMGATEDFITVYVKGEYGASLHKTQVYPEFLSRLHINENLQFDDRIVLGFGWDFGLTPACVIIQLMSNGWINCLYEITSSNCGLEDFVKNKLNVAIAKNFPGAMIGTGIGDLSGKAGDLIKNKPIVSIVKDGAHLIGYLEELGYRTLPSPTNAVFERVDKVKKALTTIIDGRPQLQIHPRCKLLLEGFRGGYHLIDTKIDRKERYDPKPSKNFYSHIHDALQYAVSGYTIPNNDTKKRSYSNQSSVLIA